MRDCMSHKTLSRTYAASSLCQWDDLKTTGDALRGIAIHMMLDPRERQASRTLGRGQHAIASSDE